MSIPEKVVVDSFLKERLEAELDKPPQVPRIY